MIKQIDKDRLETTENINSNTVKKTYILIDSEEGQKLIKDHDLVINSEIEEF